MARKASYVHLEDRNALVERYRGDFPQSRSWEMKTVSCSGRGSRHRLGLGIPSDEGRSNATRLPAQTVTRALLPLAPLVAETPALAEHARSTWPWLLATLPLAFVPPAIWSPPPRTASLAQQYRAYGRRDRQSHRLFSEDEYAETMSGGMLDRRRVVQQAVSCFSGLLAAASIECGRAAATASYEAGGDTGSNSLARKAYDKFSEHYDDLDGGWAATAIGIEDLRRKLLERATGRVLEVGVGTGLNFPYYRPDAISGVDAIDLSPGMLKQALARREALGMNELVHLQQMDVQNLNFPARTFDTVVDTFSLCVFSDPGAALREMARVCKPTGRVLLLENSKSNFGPLATYQDLTATFVATKGGGKGCFWNQDVDALAAEVGLRVTKSFAALPGGVFRSLECVPLGAQSSGDPWIPPKF